MASVYDCVKVITSDENNNFSPIKCHQVWNVETVLDIPAYVVERKVTSFSGLNSIGRQRPDLDSRTSSHVYVHIFSKRGPFHGLAKCVQETSKPSKHPQLADQIG